MNLRENRQTEQRRHHKLKLMLCDVLLLLFVDILMLVIYPSADAHLANQAVMIQALLGAVCVYGWRIIGGVYRQIWRYGGTMAYMQMILMDFLSGVTYYAAQSVMLPNAYKISFVRVMSICARSERWQGSLRV
jgi:FlaA1/EpsC-like NDP-sugar epimerase